MVKWNLWKKYIWGIGSYIDNIEGSEVTDIIKMKDWRELQSKHRPMMSWEEYLERLEDSTGSII